MAEEVAVLEVNHDRLVNRIIKHYMTKEPLYIWGRTGIGKSYTVRKAAKILAEKLGRRYSERIEDADDEHFVLIDRRLAQMEPTDLLGVLYKDNGVSKWHYPDWLYRLSRQRDEQEGNVGIKGVIFLDELNLAPQLVQNAAYSLVLDRRVGELELAEGVVVIAAGNVAEDRAYTFDLSDPLRTRFTHTTLKIPVFKDEEKKQGWFYWAAENGVDSRILAFLSFQPSLLFKYVENDRTFPTPRGWEKASKLMEGEPNEEAWMAVAEACGYVAGLQFKQFMELGQEIDLEEILKNPRKFLDLERSVMFSVIASLTHLYSQKSEKYAEKLLKFTAHLFTGIYDESKLNEYIRLAAKCEELSGEERERIRKKMKELEGEREAEFAALILTSMKAANRDHLSKTIKSSKYTAAVADLMFFLV